MTSLLELLIAANNIVDLDPKIVDGKLEASFDCRFGHSLGVDCRFCRYCRFCRVQMCKKIMACRALIYSRLTRCKVNAEIIPNV